MDETAEIIEGQGLEEMLQWIIDSRRVCRMEIPRTQSSWLTLLLGFEQVGKGQFLMIDKVVGFEKFLSRSPDQEVSFDFIEKGGVSCQFKTRVVECHSRDFWVELPKSIRRLQRRRFYRVEARSETEIVFHLPSGEEEQAQVEDFSLGGVAFLTDRPLPLRAGDIVKGIDLAIFQGESWVRFHILQARVVRVDEPSFRRYRYAMEFSEMSDHTKELLWRHVFEEQRAFLRKTYKA